MANPFDQFDAPQPVPAGNPFDQFDNPSVSTISDVGRSFGEGVVSGVNGLLGLPGDINRAADYGTYWLAGKVGEKLGLLPQTMSGLVTGEKPSASSFAQSQMAAMEPFRPLPSSADIAAKENSAFGDPYQPQTTAGQYAQTVGSFLPGAVALPAEGVAGVAGNAIKYGVVPGVASEAAGQATQGTDLEPYARTAAGIVGGFGADAATAGAKAIVGAGKKFAEPFSAKGQESIAARTLQGAFNDPQAASAEMAKAAALQGPGEGLGETVPGSKPTTGQLTGDLGALSLERELATRQPGLFKNNEFGTGAEQQNAARSAALGNIQATGSPEEIGNTVRQQMAAIDAAHDAAVAKATADAQSAGFDASNAAQSHVGEVAAKSDAAVNDATTQAQTAGQSALDAAQGHVEGLGAQSDAHIAQASQAAREAASGIGTGATPEDVGATLRGTLQTARDTAKGQERALWNAVDPHGTLALPAAPVSDAANSIANSLPSTTKPMAGEEAAIFDTASNLPSIAPFRDITALRSRISTAMRQELIQNGQSPTYARLSQLRGSVEDAIENAVAHKAAADQAAVSAGGMSPSDAVGARIANAGTSEVQGSNVSGVSPGKVSVNTTSSGTTSNDPSSGTQGQGNLGLRNNAGGQGIPGPVARPQGQVADPTPISAAMQASPSKPPKLVANIDESAAGRVRAASAATKARVQTFDNGAVGQVLKKAPTADQYQMANSAVPGKIWVAGPGGAERVQAFAKAAGAGGPPDMRAVHEAASESLRREAMTPDGVIDPKAFAKWQDKYQDALRALPADLKAKFSNAAEAAQTIAELEAHRKLNIDPLQNVVAKLKTDRIIGDNGIVDQGKFANWKAKNADAIASLPADVKAKLSTAENASKAVSEAEATRSIVLDPLQKAVEDLHRSQVVNADGIVSPKGLANWKAKNPEVLKALPDDVRAKLENASTATEAIGEAAAAKKAAMDEYQKGLLGNFVGVTAPEDITKAVSNIFGTKTAVRDMTALAGKIAANPDAKEGLRKAVADIIVRKSTGTTESGTSGLNNLNASTFQKFIRDNAATIKAAGFSDRELQSMQAVGQDMQRSQRTLSATRLPGQSNTAQDILKAIEAGNQAHPVSLLNKIALGAGAGYEAHGVHGALVGAGLGLGEHVVAGMRNAGLAKANTMVRDAILNPELAMALLKKAPLRTGRGSEATLAKMLARNSMFAAMTAHRESQQNRETP